MLPGSDVLAKDLPMALCRRDIGGMPREVMMRSKGLAVRWPLFIGVLAVSVGLLPLATGCGGDSQGNQENDLVGGDADATGDSGVLPDPEKVVHFDFSEMPEHTAGTLHIAGKEYPIKSHDDESRDLHRGLTATLNAVEDEDLTHYAEGVELPDNRMALMWTTHPSGERGGGHVLGLVGIHVPQRPLRQARMARAAEGWPHYARLLSPEGKADEAGETVNPDPDNLLTPLDTAKAILFHHPELVNLDPDVAARVWTHLENTPAVMDLAMAISTQGAAGVHDPDYDDGWAVLEPVMDDQGNEVIGQDGEPIYHYILTDTTKDAAQQPLNLILKATKNDPELADHAYHLSDGKGADDASQPVMVAKALKDGSPYTWTLAQSHVQSGLEASVEPADPAGNGRRQIKVGLKNKWLRHLSFWVAFEDADGHTIPLPADMASDGDNKSAGLKHIGSLPAVVTIMAIPLSADWEYFTVQVPDEAQAVNIYCGGLGTGHLWSGEVANQGIVLTAVFEYGIPLFFLAAGRGWRAPSGTRT